jgi:hypothetical protein
VLHVGDVAHSQPLAPTTDVIDQEEPSGEGEEDLAHYLQRVSFGNASFVVLFFAVSDKHFHRRSSCRSF